MTDSQVAALIVVLFAIAVCAGALWVVVGWEPRQAKPDELAGMSTDALAVVAHQNRRRWRIERKETAGER